MMTFPQNFHIPVSINRGESTTQSWVPVSQRRSNLWSIKRRIWGWRRLLSHCRSEGLLKMMSPSFSRLSVPLCARMMSVWLENRSRIAANPRVPGSTTSRASSSRSITGTWYDFSSPDTVDFPVTLHVFCVNFIWLHSEKRPAETTHTRGNATRESDHCVIFVAEERSSELIGEKHD